MIIKNNKQHIFLITKVCYFITKIVDFNRALTYHCFEWIPDADQI